MVKFFQLKELGAQNEALPPPIKVTVTKAKPASWYRHIGAIGTLVALQGVDVTTEVGGIVSKINFQSGQKIKSGELLLLLSDEVETSAVSTAKAQLAAAESQYQRTLSLKGKKFVSEFELDEISSNLDIAKAALESAEASLKKKSIKAPFGGILGIKNVDEGDYIAPGTKIVSLQSIDKLYLDFTLPEQFYNEVKKGQSVKFKVRSFPNQVFNGKVDAWDPILHATTRNVNVRAIADNPQARLAPGMFAEITVTSDTKAEVQTVPETAIFYNIYGEAVYVLKPAAEKKSDASGSAKKTYILEARKVEVLYRENNLAGVSKGLASGELVVTSGQLKLYPSLKVQITEDVAPFKLEAK